MTQSVPTPSAFTLDLRPPPGPEWIEVAEPWPPWVWLAALAIGLIVLLAFLRTFRRRPALTPRQLFQQQLGLVAKRLCTMPSSTLIHLDAYLRQFLHSQFGLPALTQTETELAATLRADGRFNEETQKALLAALNDAATAKFAAGYFTEEQVQGHVDALRRWVDTLPRERRT